MGLTSYSVVSVLALVACACASVSDNDIDGGAERVVLVAPVLAPPRDSGTHVTDRARQFPILVLLAQKNPSPREPQAKSLGNPEPIYVQVTWKILCVYSPLMMIHCWRSFQVL